MASEINKLGEALFAKVGEVLKAHGLKIGTGTIMNATITGAPISTRNADKKHEPEMHQTREGQEGCFGMKLHIGVDEQDRPGAPRGGDAANVHDKHRCSNCCSARKAIERGNSP